jgi:hypothetical protein
MFSPVVFFGLWRGSFRAGLLFGVAPQEEKPSMVTRLLPLGCAR